MLRDFRPISFLGSLFKILAGVLANRLRRVLLEIYLDIQAAFVDGCQILDCAPIAHECVDSRFKQHYPGLVCMLDFEKA